MATISLRPLDAPMRPWWRGEKKQPRGSYRKPEDPCRTLPPPHAVSLASEARNAMWRVSKSAVHMWMLEAMELRVSVLIGALTMAKFTRNQNSISR